MTRSPGADLSCRVGRVLMFRPAEAGSKAQDRGPRRARLRDGVEVPAYTNSSQLWFWTVGVGIAVLVLTFVAAAPAAAADNALIAAIKGGDAQAARTLVKQPVLVRQAEADG